MPAVPFGAVRAIARGASLAFVLPLLGLAACGGSSSPQDQIKSIVSDAANDPSSVCDHFSQRVLQQQRVTVDGCKKRFANSKPDPSGHVVSVTVNGNTARATVASKDGTKVFTFVKEGGDWKIDRATAAQ